MQLSMLTASILALNSTVSAINLEAQTQIQSLNEIGNQLDADVLAQT